MPQGQWDGIAAQVPFTGICLSFKARREPGRKATKRQAVVVPTGVPCYLAVTCNQLTVNTVL